MQYIMCRTSDVYENKYPSFSTLVNRRGGFAMNRGIEEMEQGKQGKTEAKGLYINTLNLMNILKAM